MSLLDTAEPELQAAETESKPEEPVVPSWMWDENTPGTGERPSWLQSKFKSVSEAAKSFNELEKMKGSAPSEYDMSKSSSWIKPDYQPLKEMQSLAKSKHVPQEVMDKFLDTVGTYINETKVNPDLEKQKLGENAQERIDRVSNWAKSNMSEKAFAALKANMGTAESIEALEELRGRVINSSSMVPGNNNSIGSGGYTIEEYRSELNANLPKYKSDPHYRKEMERKLESIYKK